MHNKISGKILWKKIAHGKGLEKGENTILGTCHGGKNILDSGAGSVETQSRRVPGVFKGFEKGQRRGSRGVRGRGGR